MNRAYPFSRSLLPMLALLSFCMSLSAAPDDDEVDPDQVPNVRNEDFVALCGENYIAQQALNQVGEALAIKVGKKEVVKAAVESADDRAPKPTQSTAPVSSGEGAGGVPGPERPTWLSFAIEQGYAASNDDGSVTVSLSPFEWMEKHKPKGYFDRNDNYRATSGLRRLTGSLTVGKPGDALDADGDGTPEAPAAVKSLSDSMLIEVQYRIMGTRDRREIEFDPESKLFAAAISHVGPVMSNLQDLYAYARPFARQNSAAVKTMKRTDDACKAAIESTAKEMLADEEAARAIFASAVAAMAASDEDVGRLVEKADGSLLLTVALSRLERKEYLGADRTAVALRALWGIPAASGGSTNKLNLDYGRVESLTPGQKDLKSATLQFEHVRPASSFLGLDLEDATWALNLTGERNWDAPEDAKKSKATLGFALNVPVSEGVSIPFSLTWANRDEFLQDQDDVVGHVGLSFNFDAFKPKKP